MGRDAARWTRLGVVAHLCEAAGALLLLVAIAAFGLESEGENVFLLVMGAIALVGAFFARRFGWWGKALGIVGAILPAVALFWTAFGLSSFPSFFDFLPGLLVIPGGLAAAACYVAAIVAGRRGNRTSSATGNERLAVRAILGLVGVVAVVTGALTLLGRSTVADQGDSRGTVLAGSFEFQPKRFSVSPGDTILVQNDDPFVHTFTVDELGIDLKLTAGDQVLVDIPSGAKAGTYIFYCRPHSNTENPGEDEEDMAGRLTIKG